MRGAWPEFNPRLSLSQEPLTDWKLAASQCPISLLVYPLNREDGWKGSLTSYRDLRGRAAPELDGPKRSMIFITLHCSVRSWCSLSLLFPVWEFPLKTTKKKPTLHHVLTYLSADLFEDC